jgi:Polyketide cyclase / dehydrase and lipid transport
MASDYHFITNWRFKASVQEIIDILADATDLPRWWPAVYLEAKRIKTGDETGIGSEVSLYTKGYLPYTLRWDFTVTQVEDKKSMTIEARGDFVGRGIWTFEQVGDETLIVYDWKIEAKKPLLRNFTFLLRPIFSWNHHWAMRMGAKSLELELVRRRAKTEEERQKVPAPPAATPSNPLAWLMMVIRG